MAIDLHIHSTASDGNIQPVEVVRMAAGARLKIIALADHETTAGYEPALREGEQLSIQVIPAVELLTFYKDKEVHLLGYLRNPKQKYLQEKLAELRRRRTDGAKFAIAKLAEYGFPVPWADVEQIAGKDVAVSTGHILRALRGRGYINNHADVFKFISQYLNRGGLAHQPYDFSFDEGVDLIRQADGLPILAHPGLVKDDTIVEELCVRGIAGLEVYYYYFGRNKKKWIKTYQAMAEQKRLLKTGGSDYHGTVTPVLLGEHHVPPKGVQEFLDLFGISK